MTIKDDFGLLGLEPGVSKAEIKKAYRRLAKENHPDRFRDETRKKKQAAVMSRINDAYRAALAWKPENAGPETRFIRETDTVLYKKGVDIFDRLNVKIAMKIGSKEYDMKTVREKTEYSRQAAECFRRLLEKYPESDWAYDSEDRLKDLEKYLLLLAKNLEFLENHKIGTTKKGTPIWKKKKEGN